MRLTLTFEESLRHNFRLTPADVTVSDVRGVWKVKQVCPGGSNCRHASRIALGPCSGGGELVIGFVEYGNRDEQGKFISPYAEWQRQRAALADGRKETV